ncbi:MAG: hypothetical protein K1X35_01215 [Caulobacteraceae bacterium]|nr:hypothetical protein [Caulobacteraceae bacterium]
MGYAAAAALTFCTPSTGVAAQPAAVVDAFLAGWNANNPTLLSKTMVQTAQVDLYDDDRITAEDFLRQAQANRQYFAPVIPTSTSIRGGWVDLVIQSERPCLRVRGDTRPCEASWQNSNMSLEVAEGCITEFALSLPEVSE